MNTLLSKRGKNEGFTLIELLIVLAIIGLLATLAIVALTGAQRSGRDVKREADLSSIQSALELYWSQSGAAEYPELDASATNTWDELAAELDDYISALPTDPNHSSATDARVYVYMTYDDDDTDSDDNQTYFLRAQIEDNARQSLTQDTDGTVGGVGFKYITSNGTTLAADLTDASMDCADSPSGVGGGYYCLTGSTVDPGTGT